MPNGLKKIFDEALGPPGEALKTVRAISESLAAVDEAKLRLVKSIIDSIGKVKGSPQELEAFLEIIKLITATDIEKLTVIRDIISLLVRAMRYLPKEGLKGLPLKEIVEEFRQSG